MGIFDRFSTVLRSNINDLISRAENPEKMLNQLIIDMKSQLAKAKQEVAGAIADEKKLQSDAEAMKKQADDWERRAMLAVQEGRDDLAKQALMRYNENLQGAQQLHETWVKSKAETEAAQALAPPAQRQDRGSQAQEEHPGGARQAGRGPAAHPGDDVRHGRPERLRVVRADGGEDRSRTSARRSPPRSCRRSSRATALAKQFEALEYKGSSDQQLLELKARMGLLQPGGAGEAASSARHGRGRRDDP